MLMYLTLILLDVTRHTTKIFSRITFPLITDRPVVLCVYLAASGLILLVFSGELCRSALQGFEFDVARNFGYKCTADVPLWLLKHQEVTQHSQDNRLTKYHHC